MWLLPSSKVAVAFLALVIFLMRFTSSVRLMSISLHEATLQVSWRRLGWRCGRRNQHEGADEADPLRQRARFATRALAGRLADERDLAEACRMSHIAVSVLHAWKLRPCVRSARMPG